MLILYETVLSIGNDSRPSLYLYLGPDQGKAIAAYLSPSKCIAAVSSAGRTLHPEQGKQPVWANVHGMSAFQVTDDFGNLVAVYADVGAKCLSE